MNPYNSTTHYYSESQGDWVALADLPLPHIVNIMRKHRDRPGFKGSPLYTALEVRLCPGRGVACMLLAQRGKCSYYWPTKEGEARVRRFFYSIGKALNTKVTTHRNGDFIEAECEPTGEVVQVNFKHNRFAGAGR